MIRYLAAAVMTAGLLTTACGGTEDEASSGLVWFHDDLEAASAEAEASQKPLLIDMYADWCPPCVTLGEEYFTSDEMQGILSEFVLVKIDVDNPEMAEHAQRYNVSSIPCVIIARADGTEIDRIVGTTPTVGDYVEALQSILDRF